MVLAFTGVHGFAGADLICDPIGGQPVVDAPAGVVDLALWGPLGEPGVDAAVVIVEPGGISMDLSEGVGEAGIQQKTELLALLIGEASGMVVGGRVGDIDLLMGHVEVTTGQDRLTGI